MPRTPRHPTAHAHGATAARTTRRLIIAFAIVEAIILGWALFAGRIH